jgi:hypothetical protein
MEMKRTGIIWLLTAFLMGAGIASCSHQEHAQPPRIELDNGKKWLVHDNMMTHIVKMSEDVKAASLQTDRDYDGLNKNLLEGIDALTSDCTMKGKAHDELHKWLLPFIASANAYKSDMSEAQKSEWFNTIEMSMNEFDQYFK